MFLNKLFVTTLVVLSTISFSGCEDNDDVVLNQIQNELNNSILDTPTAVTENSDAIVSTINSAVTDNIDEQNTKNSDEVNPYYSNSTVKESSDNNELPKVQINGQDIDTPPVPSTNQESISDKNTENSGDGQGKGKNGNQNASSGNGENGGDGKGKNQNNASNNNESIYVDSNGSITADIDTILFDTSTSDLNETEKTSLLFVREEEKLARDVYIYLDNRYSDETSIFANILKAEQTHTDLVKDLITRYGLKDPVSENEDLNLGVFKNQDLQILYNSLTLKGAISLVDAIEVGITIEDLDIRDIELDMTKTDNEDILIVYKNLVKGSESHMKAFINKYDGTYIPQFISQSRFDLIFIK